MDHTKLIDYEFMIYASAARCSTEGEKSLKKSKNWVLVQATFHLIYSGGCKSDRRVC